MNKFINVAVILTVFFIPLTKADDQESVKPPIAYKIISDPNIKNAYQDGEKSIRWFNNEIKKRKSAENDGKPYKTSALKTTLQNLKGFTQHIIDGNQFQEGLTGDESSVFNNILFELGKLDAEEPEYKALIELSQKLIYLYSSSIRMRMSVDEKGISKKSYPLEHIPPSHTRNYEDKTLFRNILTLADKTDILLLPTFEPLSISDFVGFSHLKLYPLGLITSYTEMADGEQHSPNRFLNHDIAHTRLIIRHKCSQEPFESMESVLNFKKLLISEGELFFNGNSNIMNMINLSLFMTTHEIGIAGSPLAKLYNEESLKEYFNGMLILQQHAGSPYNAIPKEDVIKAVFWFASVYDFWKLNNKPAQLSEDSRLTVKENFLNHEKLYDPLLAMVVEQQPVP
ncbi:hypothetical protein NX722_02240 [Endozoicomonas gorgoniicola]|uniref:DUF3160 domain-containing protein n=1 Tax=Endozoicomonas gorgoniicola TaxID=1234144 RepID=A0ABT3MQ32_9GAMM|nr:hypothetical protein [Endozoicomonas gorgoniicola]MCW7551479.1 hypothetical protein [Endozoicomonas gorgoniicola]